MKIYEVMPRDGYEWINLVNDNDYEIFDTLDGERMGSSWQPLRVKVVGPTKRRKFQRSDFPWLGGYALVMRASAADCLRDILESNGEILPIFGDDGSDMFVFNSKILDALDVCHSSLINFPGTDRIMKILKHSFLEDVILKSDIFKLPYKGSSTFVSQKFFDRVISSNLRGLDMIEVWSA